MAYGDEFGMSDLHNRLKAFCKEHGIDKPKSWRYGFCFWRRYAVSLHLVKHDRWDDFDANVVFLVNRRHKKYKKRRETKLIGRIVDDLQEPFVLTLPTDMSTERRNMLKGFGLSLMPVRWTAFDDNEDEYEVFMKGQMEMGPFANMMEKVKETGKIVFKR